MTNDLRKIFIDEKIGILICTFINILLLFIFSSLDFGSSIVGGFLLSPLTFIPYFLVIYYFP